MRSSPDESKFGYTAKYSSLRWQHFSMLHWRIQEFQRKVSVYSDMSILIRSAKAISILSVIYIFCIAGCGNMDGPQVSFGRVLVEVSSDDIRNLGIQPSPMDGYQVLTADESVRLRDYMQRKIGNPDAFRAYSASDWFLGDFRVALKPIADVHRRSIRDSLGLDVEFEIRIYASGLNRKLDPKDDFTEIAPSTDYILYINEKKSRESERGQAL